MSHQCWPPSYIQGVSPLRYSISNSFSSKWWSAWCLLGIVHLIQHAKNIPTHGADDEDEEGGDHNDDHDDDDDDNNDADNGDDDGEDIF